MRNTKHSPLYASVEASELTFQQMTSIRFRDGKPPTPPGSLNPFGPQLACCEEGRGSDGGGGGIGDGAQLAENRCFSTAETQGISLVKRR